MTWDPTADVACLIGPGDSCKTTILDAIEWCLWPRWSLRVSDADFHDLTVSEELRIEVTVIGVPETLLTVSGFDTHQRFIDSNGAIHDEPSDDADESALTVRMSVDEGLEPRWHVVCGDRQEPKPIGPRQRAALGATRLGDNPDRDLRWGRGSALARLTASTSGSSRTLASAYRVVRTHVTDEDLTDLNEALSIARDAAPAFGARIDSDTINAGIGPEALTPNTSVLGLHSDGVPLTSYGLGTRRLLSLALQSRAIAGGAIVLIDEVEHGLEPHRLRHLLHVLSDAVGSAEPHSLGQVFLTTHSPTALVELNAPQLHVVRPQGARAGLEVRTLTEKIQPLVRAQPEALLASTVIVGEGATEYGMLRGLDRVWSQEPDGAPLVHRDVALADGGGHQAPGRARDLAAAGYRVALLCDSDRPITPSAAELEAHGVSVFQWNDGMDIERRLAADLPLATIGDLLDFLSGERGPGQIRGDIVANLDSPPEDLPKSIVDWPNVCGEAAFRAAVGAAMSSGSWIKRIGVAQDVGELIGPALPEVPDGDLAKKLAELRAWAS